MQWTEVPKNIESRRRMVFLMSGAFNYLSYVWERSVPVPDYKDALPKGKFISEWVEIQNAEEDFEKAIQYLQLWKYFVLIKSKNIYELHDEQFVFKPAWGDELLKQPATLAVKLYIKEKIQCTI